MRNLLTGTIATLGLVTVLVSSASAESWLDHGGPGVVISQGAAGTANVQPTDPFAYEQNADRPLDQGGPGAVVNQTDETTNVDPTGQYAFEETSKSRLHRDAYAEDLARDAERGQVQTGQNMGQNGPARIGG